MRILLYLVTIIYLLMQLAFAATFDDLFNNSVHELLREKITDDRVIIEVKYSSGDKLSKVIAKQNNISSIYLEQYDPSHNKFKVRIKYHNKQEELISGKYTLFIEIPVAARYIKHNDIIKAFDITSKKIKLNSFRGDYLTDESEVIGMQAKKYITMGSKFQARDIVQPAVLEEGDSVKIIYSSRDGSLEISVSGTALAKGYIGKQVNVRNNDSGAEIHGMVINKNTVKVGNNSE